MIFRILSSAGLEGDLLGLGGPVNRLTDTDNRLTGTESRSADQQTAIAEQQTSRPATADLISRTADMRQEASPYFHSRMPLTSRGRRIYIYIYIYKRQLGSSPLELALGGVSHLRLCVYHTPCSL